jgi:hypothetical protein
MKTNNFMKSTFLKVSLTGLVVVCLSLNVLAKVAITKNLADTTGKSKMKMEKMKSDKMSSDKMAPKKMDKMSDKKMSPKKMAKDSGKMSKM